MNNRILQKFIVKEECLKWIDGVNGRENLKFTQKLHNKKWIKREIEK